MISRREAVRLLATVPAAAAFGGSRTGFGELLSHGNLTEGTQGTADPLLAPGAPTSPERLQLIEAFKRASQGIDANFEARVHTSDWTMPYRLFRPAATRSLPLVLFLHGSGGLGTDNQRQMGLGNIFGTRLWALPEHQRTNPCYVVVPQTDRGWARYDPPAPGDSVARVVPGLGDGARLALEIVDRLCREFPIDARRVYVAGQSMGGGGTWHVTAHRPGFFAAAVTCCGSATLDKPSDSAGTPVWNFHGTADATVPLAVSRDRVAALQKAGAHPVATEYAGVGHNAWEWAFTEPALIDWMFSKRRAT